MNSHSCGLVGRGMRGSLKLLIPLLLVALLNTGCLTRALWSPEIRHASSQPNLSLAVAPDREDILVQYDERQSDKIRRRSYWLFDYATVKGGEGKPRFVRLDTSGLTPLAFSDDGSTAESVGEYVVVPSLPHGFDLLREGVSVGHFELPTYSADAKPTFGRIVLTPVTAVADGAIAVGATVSVVGFLAFCEYLESGDWAADLADAAIPDSNHDGHNGHDDHKGHDGLRAVRHSE